MKNVVSVIAAMAVLAFGVGSSLAAGPMKEAPSSMDKQPSGDSVKGTLLKIEGDYFVIEGHDGEQVRVHVDESTQLERVVLGELVRAYITEKGHVTRLQRVNGSAVQP
ncbi:MAG: exported protein of unknown function [Nitrospira sp.]|jgi:hypothetical protein|nr:exported protein of unknown function [Nitrospira sp.]